MKCCRCKREVEHGPEALSGDDRERDDLAIRCAYCFVIFCMPCSLKHFEARNAGKVQKRVVKTTVTEEWIEEPTG